MSNVIYFNNTEKIFWYSGLNQYLSDGQVVDAATTSILEFGNDGIINFPNLVNRLEDNTKFTVNENGFYNITCLIKCTATLYPDANTIDFTILGKLDREEETYDIMTITTREENSSHSITDKARTSNITMFLNKGDTLYFTFTNNMTSIDIGIYAESYIVINRIY